MAFSSSIVIGKPNGEYSSFRRAGTRVNNPSVTDYTIVNIAGTGKLTRLAAYRSYTPVTIQDAAIENISLMVTIDGVQKEFGPVWVSEPRTLRGMGQDSFPSYSWGEWEYITQVVFKSSLVVALRNKASASTIQAAVEYALW